MNEYLPVLIVGAIIGSFAMKNSLFDVWVMLIAGVVLLSIRSGKKRKKKSYK